MKKILAVLILAVVAVSANAQHHGYYPYGHRYNHGGGWVAPLVLGGVITYALTRPVPPPVVVQQPPVVIQQQPTVVYIDGIAYTKQWVQINGQWQEVLIRL